MPFALASVALGMIAFFASEAFFWVTPHADFALPDQTLTCAVYMAAASVALWVLARAGLSGLRAAFLGGAILGFLIEGAVVGTIYEAMPFQLVWTPLAWHGLISGAVVLGLGRSGLPPWRLTAGWLALGLFGASFSVFWPSEMAVAGAPEVAAYLLGLGLLVPLGLTILDRIGSIEPPSLWALAPGGGLMAFAWAVQGIAAADPWRLILPAILAALALLAARLGKGASAGLAFGPRRGSARHLLFLIAPLTLALLAPQGWSLWPEGQDIWYVALPTCGISLGWLGLLTVQDLRRRRPEPEGEGPQAT